MLIRGHVDVPGCLHVCCVSFRLQISEMTASLLEKLGSDIDGIKVIRDYLMSNMPHKVCVYHSVRKNASYLVFQCTNQH